jgi:hypothetical protein
MAARNGMHHFRAFTLFLQFRPPFADSRKTLRAEQGMPSSGHA